MEGHYKNRNRFCNLKTRVFTGLEGWNYRNYKITKIISFFGPRLFLGARAGFGFGAGVLHGCGLAVFWVLVGGDTCVVLFVSWCNFCKLAAKQNETV